MKRLIKMLTMFTTFILGICNVYALDISIDEIKVLDRSENMTISNVTSNNLTITPSIVFNNIGDYVTFKVTFKGSDIKNNKIISVTDNNNSDYIGIKYKYDDTLSSPLYITMYYEKGSTEKTTLSDVGITINLEDQSEETTNVLPPTNNPKTGLLSYIIVPILLTLFSVILIRYYIKHNDNITTMIIVLFLLVCPLVVKAIGSQKLSMILDTSNVVINGVVPKTEEKPVEETPKTEEKPVEETPKDEDDTPSEPTPVVDTKPKATAGQGLWVAHQKNDADRVQNAINAGFWGIEVDVRQNGSVFRLEHNTYHGYNLDTFLDTCKKNNIIAVLDIKEVSDYNAFVGLVNSKGMLNHTIFQTGSASVVNSLYSVNSNVRIWFLNSANKGALRTSTINPIKNKLEGVNMLALSVDASVIKQVHNMGLTICAFSYLDTMYDSEGKSAANLRSWGADYLMANAIK